jgi:hypothetical protein
MIAIDVIGVIGVRSLAFPGSDRAIFDAKGAYMNLRLLIIPAFVAGCAACSVAAPQASQQQQPQVVAHPKVDPGDKVYPLDQIIPATVHDAWLLSGKNEEAFFDIVEQLAQLSAEKRDLTLPDSAAAGRRMGEMIKQKAKADHDQLLYVIVDEAVRAVGTKAGPTARK